MNNNNFPYSNGGSSLGGGDDFYGSSFQGAASSNSFALAAQGGSSSQYAAAAAASTSYSDSDDDNVMPWENHGWVPRNKSGKQKTPNMIRGELQRYVDQCKAEGTTQTSIIEKMGVNNNTFRKFMDPGTYKNQWSATQNGTYWAGAKLLAQVAYDKELAKKMNKGKRRSSGGDSSLAAPGGAKKAKVAGEASSAPRKKSAAEVKLEALQLIQRINAVEGVHESSVVYDTCPQVVTKIKSFLQRDGMTKANLLLAFGNINNNSLGRFLSGKKQDQCGNVTYRAAYVFFEKLRTLEGQKKSAARLKNEREHPTGFSLEKERKGKYVFVNPAFPRW